jgi:DNA polymerase I
MYAIGDLPFDEVWVVDFEFMAPPGESPTPICCVAHELKTERVIRLFGEELTRRTVPPYDISPRALLVAYYASAEVGCHLALGWPVPCRIVDLYAEYRWLTNGLDMACGDRSLLGALATFGLPAIDAAEKEAMRALAMRGGPYTPTEAAGLLDYCESDVISTKGLLRAMLARLDIPRAVLRGRYQSAVARMERQGVPIDVETHGLLVRHWESIKRDLVERIDRAFGVFEGTAFRAGRWADYLARNSIPWPRLPSGRLALDEDTFREVARTHPEISPVRELRHALSELRLNSLQVGSDGRNRVLLSPFGARSSRNTPSNSKFIFGPAVWLRGLVQPPPGRALAYIDWSQQEFGIAACLSGDVAMQSAYESGDPYLTFAKQAGRVPAHGTKSSHAAEREQFKGAALAVQYGMEAESLAARLGVPPIAARDLLRAHRTTYPRFWCWSDAAVDHAMLLGRLYTVFGWQIHRGANPNPRSFRNFPMQANGAEMLRLACCYATEAGIQVCAPVHDALLIEAPASDISAAVHRVQEAMERASAAVLHGFRLRSEAKLILHPDRYDDERGRVMWSQVMALLEVARRKSEFAA